jgi:hypothetical protein
MHLQELQICCKVGREICIPLELKKLTRRLKLVGVAILFTKVYP